MLKIRKTKIQLTRGDSAYITLEITDGSGNPIELTENDIVRCQVREQANGGKILFSGEILRDSDLVWYIHPEDTAGMPVKEYRWDAEVEFENGDVFTFIPDSPFELLSEVTEDEEP